jgi:hemoglobin
MNATNDIQTEEDVTILIHQFYTKVRQDELLAPIFNSIVKGSWDKHLQTMVDFWSTILLYTKKYLKDPMSKHLPLPLEQKHFVQWLCLFEQTIDDLFVGEVANTAKKRANAIALLMKHIKGIKNE